MIKSIVSSIVAISVLATPVVAEAKSRGDHRAERSERHRGGRVNTGEAIAIGVGALILGAAIGIEVGAPDCRSRRPQPRHAHRFCQAR